jgi:hypothetical protein
MPLITRSRTRFLLSASLCSLAAFGQEPALHNQTPVASASPGTCAPLAPNLSISSRAAIEAKVTSFDSAHLKAGSSIWFKTARPFYYPGCSLDADSVVYAHVISVSPSEISLIFDRADCNHHDQQPVRLRVIAIVGPPNELHHMHEDLPSEVAGGARQIAQAVYGTDAFDEDLNPGGPPHTIHPGIVVGIKNLKLEPTAGLNCSDKISTEGNRIQLESGSELILAITVIRVMHKQQALPAATSKP